MNFLLQALFRRVMLTGFLICAVGLFGILSPRSGTFRSATPTPTGASPWGADASAQATPSPVPTYSTYRGGYSDEAARDEEFRRRMVHEMREASERNEMGGVNAPAYHPN